MKSSIVSIFALGAAIGLGWALSFAGQATQPGGQASQPDMKEQGSAAARHQEETANGGQKFVPGPNGTAKGYGTVESQDGHKTLTGCLGQGLEEKTYNLVVAHGAATEAKNAKNVEIVPSKGVDLKDLLGNEVRLTGAMSKANQAEEKGEPNPEKQQFVVDSAKKVSEHCS